MPVSSPYILYVGTSAYDLRKVSSVASNPSPSLVNVRFIDCPQATIAFDKTTFEAAWESALRGTAYTRVTPTTGSSIVISSSVHRLIIDPAGTLATLTVTMPATPVDGQSVSVSAGSFGVTALTMLPNAGQTFATGAVLTTLLPSGFAEFMYNATVARWYRVG